MIPVPGHPIHAIALLPGDDIHLAPHDIEGIDWEGHHWREHVECAEADVQVDRVRREGPDKASVYWHQGPSVTGVTVYGPTSLIPLLRRVA
jgi:hypothetical protein